MAVAAVAALISIAAFVESNRASKRESYVVAREILKELTTGEVGHARDVIGTLRYGSETGWRALDYSDLIKQYYLLEWALECAGFGYKGLRPAGHEVRDSMRDAIEWHIRELSAALALLHKAFGRDMVDDVSWQRVKEILHELDLKTPKTHSSGSAVDDPEINPAELAKVSERVAMLRDRSAGERPSRDDPRPVRKPQSD